MPDSPPWRPAQRAPWLQRTISLLCLPLALLLAGQTLGMLQAGMLSQRSERYLRHVFGRSPGAPSSAIRSPTVGILTAWAGCTPGRP